MKLIYLIGARDVVQWSAKTIKQSLFYNFRWLRITVKSYIVFLSCYVLILFCRYFESRFLFWQKLIRLNDKSYQAIIGLSKHQPSIVFTQGQRVQHNNVLRMSCDVICFESTVQSKPSNIHLTKQMTLQMNTVKRDTN